MIFKDRVSPTWDDAFKNLAFVKRELSNEESAKWAELGYSQTKFMGETYGGKDPIPEWAVTAANEIGMSKCGFAFLKMVPGIIMPVHVDQFSKYCEVFDVDRSQVVRAIVFLENWQGGHYFEIGDQAICNWKKGDYVLWSGDTPHAAANIGTSDRYTLQITGVLDYNYTVLQNFPNNNENTLLNEKN